MKEFKGGPCGATNRGRHISAGGEVLVAERGREGEGYLDNSGVGSSLPF